MRLPQRAQDIVGNEPLIGVLRRALSLPIRIQRARALRGYNPNVQRRFEKHPVRCIGGGCPKERLKRRRHVRRQWCLHQHGYASRVDKDGGGPLEAEARKRVHQRQWCLRAGHRVAEEESDKGRREFLHADMRVGDVHVVVWCYRLLPGVDQCVKLPLIFGQRRSSRVRGGRALDNNCGSGLRLGNGILGGILHKRGWNVHKGRWAVARSWGGGGGGLLGHMLSGDDGRLVLFLLRWLRGLRWRLVLRGRLCRWLRLRGLSCGCSDGGLLRLCRRLALRLWRRLRRCRRLVLGLWRGLCWRRRLALRLWRGLCWRTLRL
ncbi:hypothetical protein C8F04DRAFT_1069799 [Mycena alexandri]|uniref:Uncharacterized protein n=1 Tax=Mycena alexandri TaxID=1745969 RepID=A0AAD6TIH9_9AGAR|nr:hypothetical protein C8F04DRAFT_1069799 [Mycena alexandri]